MSSNPLDIAELLDHILGFVDATRDLQASARVNRAWCRSSQVRLLHEVKLDEPRTPARTRRLLQTLHKSRHLAQFIQNLVLREIPAESLDALAKFLFPSLHSLFIYDSSNFCNQPILRAIQRLLQASPALCAVRIACTFRNEVDAVRIWDGCSESIRHLSFSFNLLDQAGDAVFPAGDTRRRIKLESFSGRSNTVAEILLWLQDPSCPFDLSDIKALQLNEPIDTLVNSIHGPVYDNLQILSTDPDILDLSCFQRLSQLELRVPSPFNRQFLLPRTIRPENRHHLRTLIIHMLRLSTDGAQETARLLSQLGADFPNLKTVVISAFFVSIEVEMDPDQYFQPQPPGMSLRWCLGSADLGPWYNKIV